MGFDERPCIVALTAHGDPACVVRSDGALYCWGTNTLGGLGDGSAEPSRLVPGPAMISDVVAASSGENTVCAIKRDGTLWCWGLGTSGQIGDGAGVDRSLPSPVQLPDRVVEVRTAQSHTCALTELGFGYCWGDNTFAALGTETTSMLQLTPVGTAIGGNLALALGDNVTCMIRPDRAVSCWGNNSEGELGNGTVISSMIPTRVVGIIDPVISIAGGCHRHWCAATEPGDVWCWGENLQGQTGKGAVSMFENRPVRVPGVAHAVQVGVGADHSCARTSTNEVWCWGSNIAGQLGDGTLVDRLAPVRVDVTGTLIDLQLSCRNTFVVRDDGSVLAWGGAGQLGTGETVDRPTPEEVPLRCD